MVVLFFLLLDVEWILEIRDVCLKGIIESIIWVWFENIFYLFYILLIKKFKLLLKYKFIVSEIFYIYNLVYLEV